MTLLVKCRNCDRIVTLPDKRKYVDCPTCGERNKFLNEKQQKKLAFKNLQAISSFAYCGCHKHELMPETISNGTRRRFLHAHNRRIDQSGRVCTMCGSTEKGAQWCYWKSSLVCTRCWKLKYGVIYRAKNRDRIIKYDRQYLIDHPEYNKQYYIKNRDRLLEHHKQYYYKNKDTILRYNKQYRAEHRDELRRKQRLKRRLARKKRRLSKVK